MENDKTSLRVGVHMKIENVDKRRVTQFLEYCRKHRMEVDDSFLYEDDLSNFNPNDDNPTSIVLDEDENIIAAASLIIDEYNRRGKKARFRIFHSEAPDRSVYKLLLQSLLPHTGELEKLYIFVPLTNHHLMEVMAQLEFIIERYAFLLVREATEIPGWKLPYGYIIRSFQLGKDEEIWSEVRNLAFSNLKGHETPVTPEMIKKQVASSDYIEGGMKILYHNDKPVGIVRGADDEYEGTPIMNIGPLAIIPDYQGKGLGRILLRAALQFANESSYKQTILSVNGENERAKSLYLREGYKQVEGVACFQMDLMKN